MGNIAKGSLVNTHAGQTSLLHTLVQEIPRNIDTQIKQLLVRKLSDSPITFLEEHYPDWMLYNTLVSALTHFLFRLDPQVEVPTVVVEEY